MNKLLVLIAIVATTTCASALAEDQSPLNGIWKATFADSLASGTVFLTLEVHDDGSVTGNYRANTGGFGTVAGSFDGQTFSFTLEQGVEDCPGFYRGSLALDGEAGRGEYVGEDCLGKHENGVVSMIRASEREVAALRSPDVYPAGDIYVHGKRYWVSKSSNYMILVSAEQEGSYFTLHVAVQNDSPFYLTFDPEMIVVEDLFDSKVLAYKAPDEIAKKVRRRAAWAAFFRAFAAGMQAYGQSQPTTSYHYGTVNAYDKYGNWAYGTYSGTTTTYVAPDTTEIQRQSASDIAAIRERSEAEVERIQTGSANAHTLAPKSYVLGYVYFSKAKRKSLKELVGIKDKDFLVRVSVPLGDGVFKFVFPIKALEAIQNRK